MAFFPLLIPVFISLNFIFLIFFLFRGKKGYIILSMIILLLGYKFFNRTYSIPANPSNESKVKLLSYNVRVFNSYMHLRTPEKTPDKIIKWVSENDADIKCFQELYHDPEVKLFNVMPILKKNSRYSYFEPASVVLNQHFGLAIFSKYPVIRKGEVKFPKATLNQAIFADIVIKKDTLRVYNVHLQSMSIDEGNLTMYKSGNVYPRLKDLAKRIKRGAIYRSGQIQALMEHMKSCPHKIILSGDLNDTPYSYSYEKLSEIMNNGFEEKGSGFGFTYNGKLFFLRIDNIFSDTRIKVDAFKTRRDIGFTDHYPLEISFSF